MEEFQKIVSPQSHPSYEFWKEKVKDRLSHLPLEFYHPKHPEHPLTLNPETKQPFWSTPKCVSCDDTYFVEIAYHCSICKFGLCVNCTILALENRKIKLECHSHPLTLMQKHAYFYCDVCNDFWSKEKLSYVCDICPFWIHQRCSNLPSAKLGRQHPHQLSLAYHVPITVFQYRLKCDICNQNFRLPNWLYYCGPCRYFIHADCEIQRIDSKGLDRPKERKDAVFWGGLIFQLPKEMNSELIKPFINDASSCVQEIESKMKHFSHDHQLILSSKTLENVNGEEILCDGCIQPILSQYPYYTCEVEGCSYLLHTACAKLPRKVQKHPMHPHHDLTLQNFKKELGYFFCSRCTKTCNGFFFECEPCKFKLDLHCAIFSVTIAHQGHNRDHDLKESYFISSICVGCGRNISGMGYKCYLYCDFYLHYECAILPIEVRHRWDKHNLHLQFQPDCHHDEYEFYCEVCEEEIHPKRWHYYCQECDQSFHPFCIPRIGKDRFMKFGSTIKVDNKIHEHILTSVRECGFDSSCRLCGVKLYSQKGFECEACTFFLCYGCACHAPPNWYSD